MSQQHPSSSPSTLFEVSFEVCNKVGGIHTVLATKAPTLIETYGDDYVTLGPWLLSDEGRRVPFEEEAGFEAFAERCREMGLPVRVGRWLIPGRPRAVLIEFSGLYDEKDDVLAELWEDHSVDSIEGGWDYVEPVLFGYAAGKVIEAWCETFVTPEHRRAVAQFHEWMTGAGLLYLRRVAPNVGTVFTTHATMLGRALSSLGHSPEDGLGDETPEALARTHGVVAKHSLEGICARAADVFTTVSEITAREAELLHKRAPQPVLPNGIDLAVLDELAGETPRDEVRGRLVELAGRFLGEDVSDAALVATSGRYEYHNKGLDVVLDSLAELGGTEGRRVVLFLFVPAGNSGLKAALREREGLAPVDCDGPIGIATHHLFEPDSDPIQARSAELGLDNRIGSRVKVVHVPIYLTEQDGFLDLDYEAVLRAVDLTTFPSYYEPWGYTPQESLALGVPTITSDFAGFGRWASAQGLGAGQGVTVVPRVQKPFDEVVGAHTAALERFLGEGPQNGDFAAACREAAGRTAWSELIENYRRAFDAALEAVQGRLEAGVPFARRPRARVTVQSAEEGASPHLRTFEVSGSLPAPIAALERLSRNYAWAWDYHAQALFAELDPELWESVGRSPVLFLRRVDAEVMERAAQDADYTSRVGAAARRFDDYIEDETPAARFDSAITHEHPVAYFSAEFGIHESLRIYSGGLGILAGDHLKSASDLNLPLIAVGLFYRKGYITQHLTAEGEQVAIDLDNEPADLALERVDDPQGEPLVLGIALPSRELLLRAWRARIGRVDLYLLDSDVEGNRDEDREITRNLYGGDETTRIQQEIVLGRGGARLLRRLGIDPSVWHMNEGHAGFLCLQRVSYLVRERGLTFEEAREVVRSNTAFTTHTPVPAGHDRFSEDLVRRYFSDASEWVGLPWERFYALGQPPAGAEDFNMTMLGLSFAGFVNGVSKMHGEVSRTLLHEAWPRLLEDEVPVGSVTNGIHLPTWTAPEIAALVQPDGARVDGESFATHAPGLADAALWRARQSAKRRLLDVARKRLERSFVERHDSPLLLHTMLDGLDENALWIGFARRFAPYKRAHLLFEDKERLLEILASEERPVRLIVAGKAHPRDGRGKDILQEIARIARDEDFAGRVLLLEDYDMELGRALVQGVDVWLNNPTRLMEASGTSGMKAAANGGLNLSIADGWWPEAADGENGWTIGGGRVYEDQELQDQYDSATLYRLLEEEVVPEFFDRAGGLPARWIERMRHDLATIPMVFDTNRMVLDYAEKAYSPLAGRCRHFRDDRYAAARAYADEKLRLKRGFAGIAVREASVGDLTELRAGESIEARVTLDLGALRPEDVGVELILGKAQEAGRLAEPRSLELDRVDADGASVVFAGAYRLERPGTYAYGIRVRARCAILDSGPGHALRHLVRWV
ncbi:MAG: alpha-glucan family phosphorylase [bacterium]|nr:alpha-glucan family phosphorylase [bacterium]